MAQPQRERTKSAADVNEKLLGMGHPFSRKSNGRNVINGLNDSIKKDQYKLQSSGRERVLSHADMKREISRADY